MSEGSLVSPSQVRWPPQRAGVLSEGSGSLCPLPGNTSPVEGDPSGSHSPRPGLGPCGHHGNWHFRFPPRYFRSRSTTPRPVGRSGGPGQGMFCRAVLSGRGDALPTRARLLRPGADERAGSLKASGLFRRRSTRWGRGLAASAED